MADETPDNSFLELATELTIAWLSNPNTRTAADDVPAFLQTMHGAVARLAAGQASDDAAAPAPVEYAPAVTVRRSLASKDHIISLIDGKPYKTLKRHLSGHGLTPAQYRERYGLKADYPIVAEGYAELRRNLAKKIGLGRKPKAVALPLKAEKVPAAKKAEAAPASPEATAAPAAEKKPGKPRTLKIRTPAA
ncbi:MAG: MucR family transcriptional regulator [Sphingobium sp.]